MASAPGPLSNREGERVPLAFPGKNARGEVTPSLLERGPGAEAKKTPDITSSLSY